MTMTDNSADIDKSNAIDRHSQFLASQQARLAKIHDTQSKDQDGDIQLQRKLFWQTFKLEYNALHERLSVLVEVQVKQDEQKTNDSVAGNIKNRILFVTSQQRNEALEKLQLIQLSILAINHYTLRSTKVSADELNLLPQHFGQNEMPELPLADLRLLNTEIQALKKRTKDIQQIIIPKEKFRFKRYHALMLEKKHLNIPMFEDEDILFEEDEESEPVNDNGTAQLAFDGLTISDKKDCIIVVEKDAGAILVKNLQHEIIERIVPSSVLLQAKAFLIRDVINCQVQVNGLYNSVHVIDAKNTTIQIVSPVHGPVHVTNCKDSTIQIPFSRQLRIHDCTSVTFIIHVASGPIIEGCKGMKFFQSDYTNSPSKMTQIQSESESKSNDCDFDAGVNLYWDVKDFHWLKNNVKSPNFEVYTQAEFEKEESINMLLRAFSKALKLEHPARTCTEAVNETLPLELSTDGAGDESDEDSSEDEL